MTIREVNPPNAFFCPLSKKIFKDPVVLSDGNTYERSQVPEDPLIYPNRALKSIVEDYQHKKEEDPSFLSQVTRLWEGDSLPEAYNCPITYRIFHKPVIDPEGNTYEEAAAQHWIREHKSSPITRTPLSVDQLFQNTTLLKCLQELAEQEMHPALVQWKKEGPPEASEWGGNVLTTTSTIGSSLEVPTGAAATTRSEQQQQRRRTTPTIPSIQAQRRRLWNAILALLFATGCFVAFLFYQSFIVFCLFLVALLILYARQANRNNLQEDD